MGFDEGDFMILYGDGEVVENCVEFIGIVCPEGVCRAVFIAEADAD